MKKVLILLSLVFLIGCNEEKNVATLSNDTTENNSAVNVIENVTEETEEPVVAFDDIIDGKLIENNDFSIGKTLIRYPSKDDLMISADLYLIDPEAPFIILFHQAGGSRGEYIETALKFNELGFNALAVDQRSGDKENDVINLTATRAYEQRLGIYFKDAIIDVEASIEYVSEHFGSNIYILGSSYSSSIVLMIGDDYKDVVNGVLSFSPGQNIVIDGQMVADFAKNLTVPAFVTCGSHESFEAENLVNVLQSEVLTYFVPDRLVTHGAKILWAETENNDQVWEAMIEFLSQVESM